MNGPNPGIKYPIPKRLLDVAWWDWPVDKITRNLNAIRGTDIAALEAAT